MRSPSALVLGLIHHEDLLRTQSQRSQGVLVAQALTDAGFDVVRVEEYKQNLVDPQEKGALVARFLVFRRLWAQEMHHLREFRRRKGKPLKIPFRKRQRALGRAWNSATDSDSFHRLFERLEIEAALSLKHLRVWKEVVRTKAAGAVIVEDDFYLRNKSSARDAAQLVKRHCTDFDLIDLAGGLTRNSLGLREATGQDLSLPFLVANTTCGYFINRRTCEALVDMVSNKSELLYLAPDFLISELNVTGFRGSSLLPHELPLIHGSRYGNVESSIPY